MSRQKIAYLRDLCEKISTRALDLNALDALPDEDVVNALVTVKGIGRWSAEMFLIFRLHRPDVLPVGDLGIVIAVQRAYGLRTRPKPERLRRIGEAWRPYRSVASWYLWRSLDDPARASPRGCQSAQVGLIQPRLPGAVGRTYNQRLRPIIGPMLGGRSTVGHHALDVVIGVRIPASQPDFARAFGASFV